MTRADLNATNAVSLRDLSDALRSILALGVGRRHAPKFKKYMSEAVTPVEEPRWSVGPAGQKNTKMLC